MFFLVNTLTVERVIRLNLPNIKDSHVKAEQTQAIKLLSSMPCSKYRVSLPKSKSMKNRTATTREYVNTDPRRSNIRHCRDG